MSFLFQFSDQISADLRIQFERVEQAIKEQEIVWKKTNDDILKQVELLRKKKALKEEEHISKMEEVINEVKTNAVVDVWEAK